MACEKIAYKSQRKASSVARHLRSREPHLRPYHCPDCHLWHLTKNTPDRPVSRGPGGASRSRHHASTLPELEALAAQLRGLPESEE